MTASAVLRGRSVTYCAASAGVANSVTRHASPVAFAAKDSGRRARLRGSRASERSPAPAPAASVPSHR